VNYYEHHIGDYDSATAHLSILEDGVYRRLICLYYRTEAALPADVKTVCRLVRAASKAERDTVAAILREFFEQADDGWRNARCDAEITRYQDKQAKARRSAEARWGAPKAHSDGNANASDQSMRTHSDGNANGMHRAPVPRHQTPDTNHQSPDKDTRSATATDGGRVCRLMRQAGIQDGNPGHPDLLALIEAGATDAEFEQASASALGKGKGFAYALGVLKGQRRDAAEAAGAMHQGRMPKSQRTPTAAEQRVLQAVPSLAAPHLRDAAPITIDAEVTDVTPQRLG